MDQKLVGQKHGGSNPNNSTADPRVIWEDGNWAIIEAGDYPPGIGRSKTRDSLADAITAPFDLVNPLTTPPGPKAVLDQKLVKVKLADLLATPVPQGLGPAGVPTPIQTAPIGSIPSPRGFIPIKATPNNAPVAPPSPFLSKPWSKRDVPEYPHTCRVCGGRYYQGLDKIIHQETEAQDGGKCPGARKAVRVRA